MVNGDNLEQRHCAFPWCAIYCRLYYERPYQTLLRTVVAAGMQLAKRARDENGKDEERNEASHPYRTQRACVWTFLNSMQILTACSVNVIILLNGRVDYLPTRSFIYIYKFNIFPLLIYYLNLLTVLLRLFNGNEYTDFEIIRISKIM